MYEDLEVKKHDWRKQIEAVFKWNREVLYYAIWEMSLTAFDKPREVQVLIDANDNLFISVGSPGYVSFDGQDEQLYGKDKPKMKFPLKEWIHTHPFGKAYFSSTDLRTISLYRNHMDEATVLGSNERMALKFGVGPFGQDYQEYVQHYFVGEEEE